MWVSGEGQTEQVHKIVNIKYYVFEFEILQVTKNVFGEFTFQNNNASSRIEY